MGLDGISYGTENHASEDLPVEQAVIVAIRKLHSQRSNRPPSIDAGLLRDLVQLSHAQYGNSATDARGM
jgi:hypothetical protein